MRLKYNEYRAFHRGMQEGVHRLFSEDPATQAARCGYGTIRDTTAFVNGYNLTNKSDVYFYAWKGGKDLLNLAVTMKDVLLVKCEYRGSFHGYNMEVL